MKKTDLQGLIQETKAEKGLIFNSEGYVIDSYGMTRDNNAAAMANVIVTMSNEFFQDTLATESLKQVVLTSDEGLAIINKLDDDHIVCLLTNDISKAAMIKLSLRKIVLQ
ncbi:conserved hypothetical protein [Tenacibaculum sediminilitoris]|uniref:hypothetical protein n=1 Tax=Tenacibaculum sediminilitoris TaxID=1820334 RepID=UPI0038938D56